MKHFQRVKHKNWETRQALKQSKQSKDFKKKFKPASDINDEPANYGYLLNTFIAMYFIIKHFIAVSLIGEFNKLLTHFGLQNSGTSYVASEGRYEIVESMYQEMSRDKKRLIKASPWVNIIFDESTTKSSDVSYIALVVTYYDVEEHWAKTDFLKVTISFFCFILLKFFFAFL